MAAARVVHFPEFLRVINEAGVLGAEWRVESRGRGDLRGLPGGEEIETMVHFAAGWHGQWRVARFDRSLPADGENNPDSDRDDRENGELLRGRLGHAGNTGQPPEILQVPTFQCRMLAVAAPAH